MLGLIFHREQIDDLFSNPHFAESEEVLYPPTLPTREGMVDEKDNGTKV